MPDQLGLPTTAIEGIGSRTAADLEALGIHTIGDLLRVEPPRLHNALPSGSSRNEVAAWCHMAALLQIREMTPQWAEALQRIGITGVRDLRGRDLPELAEVFESARTDGIISDVPSPQAISEILRDAAVIEVSGTVNGTILSNDEPVAGATIRVGKEEATTDARGRFRIIRIPPLATSTLAIAHPDYRPARFRLRQVQPSTFSGSRTFRVRPLPSGQPRPPRVLMEARGDELPPLGGAQISLREVESGALIERDIFVFSEVSADEERVKLVLLHHALLHRRHLLGRHRDRRDFLDRLRLLQP